jgi:membrane protein required for colicin V production
LRLLAAFLSVFLTALLVLTLAAIAVSSLLKRAGLGLIDRALGAVFGLVRGLAIVMVVVLLAGLTALPRQPAWRHAMSSAPLEALANMIKVWLPYDLSKHINYE